MGSDSPPPFSPPPLRHVTRYTFELAPSKERLVKQVNTRLSEGWILQGGICIDYPANAFLPNYGQALLWKADREPPGTPAR